MGYLDDVAETREIRKGCAKVCERWAGRITSVEETGWWSKSFSPVPRERWKSSGAAVSPQPYNFLPAHACLATLSSGGATFA